MDVVTNFKNRIINEFKNYNKDKLFKDLIAGVTVAAIALPLALAFGVGSGADAAAGLITAIIGGALISLFSGTSFQISGPTGAMMAILIPLVAKHGINNLFAATFLAGILLLLAGIFKVGKFVNFIPPTVIVGFTAGIALVIAFGQLPNFLGIEAGGHSVLEKMYDLFLNINQLNISALLVGVLVIIITIIWPKKLSKVIPGSLVGIILATIVTLVLKLDISKVGLIPQSLVHEKRLALSSLFSINWELVILPALSIAALCIIESLLSGVAGARMKNEKIDANQELISQGIGNIVIPFFGGVPATAAIARSSVAIKSGSQTRLTGIIHAFILLVSVFLLNGVMAQIPLSALAGVLIVTSWKMIELDTIKNLVTRRFSGEILKLIITMIATLVFDLTIAIALGIILSIIILLIRMTNIDINVCPIDEDKLDSDITIETEAKVVYITGMLFFGISEYLEKELAQLNDKVIIFSMRGVPQIDLACAHIFLEYVKNAQNNNQKIIFSSLQPEVKLILDKAGVSQEVGSNNFYFDAKQAINSIATS